MTITELTFRNLGDSSYEVRFGSLVLGNVYRDEGAWSYSRWMIEGDRKRTERGGVNNATTKRAGYTSRESAAGQLAVMRSGEIMALINTDGESEIGCGCGAPDTSTCHLDAYGHGHLCETCCAVGAPVVR